MFNNKKKKDQNYIATSESRRISRENRKITREFEKKRERKHVDPSEYTTKMHDENNVVEFDNLHTYFFTDIGTVKSVDGVTSTSRLVRRLVSSASPAAANRLPAFR